MNFDAINQTVDSVAGRIVRNRLMAGKKEIINTVSNGF